MKENQNIEELFKNAFEDFEAAAGDQTWSNIRNELHGPSVGGSSSTSTAAKGLGGTAGWVKTALIAIVAGSSVVTTIYLTQDKPAENNEVVQETTTINVTPEAVPANLVANDDTPLKETPASIDGKITDNAAEMAELTANQEERKTPSESTTILAEPNRSIDADAKQLESNESKASSNEDQTAPMAESSSEPMADEQSEANSVVESNEIVTTESSNDAVDASSNTKVNAEVTKDITEKESIDPSIDHKLEENIAVTIPNIFTPNHDGENDVFRIDWEESDFSVNILNRTGKLIHQWQGAYGFWDGNLPDGTQAQEGIYFYQAIFKKNGKEIVKRGTVSLYR